MGWTPHELPFLVEKSRRAFEDTAAEWARIAPADDDAARAGFRMLADAATTLAAAEPLTWFDTDMCELLAELSRSVPEWTPAACIPTTSGMIAFEQPVMTAPYEAMGGGVWTVPISALVWQRAGDSVRVTAWVRMDTVPSEAVPPTRIGVHTVLEELIGITLQVSQTQDGATPIPVVGEVMDRASVVDAGTRLKAVVGAAWLLMSQPRMVRESAAPVARVKRRDTATGRRGVAPVRVSITSLVAPPPRATRGGGRQATSRWWVRGHWRQQPWGKDRALRKPVWIAPHTAGARDAPVDERPQVQVWRTGEDRDANP